MKLTANDYFDRFEKANEAFVLAIKESYKDMIGKHFGVVSKKGKKRFYGVVSDVRVSCMRNFRGEPEFRLFISYLNQKGEQGEFTIVYADIRSENRLIIYGDDVESVKLQMECEDQ